MHYSRSAVFTSHGCLTAWGGNWLNTYLELAPSTNIAALEKKFPTYLKKYLKEDDNWKNYELFLLPLKECMRSATDMGLDYINTTRNLDKKVIQHLFYNRL
jgi:putative ABC transport system permease protein